MAPGKEICEMTELLTVFVCFLIFLIGACFFSFLNVVIYRVPRNISYVKGFSFCPTCGHRLYLWDMVPVFSYIFLRGKCRYCKTHIPVRDTLTELLGGTLAILTVLRFGAQGSSFSSGFGSTHLEELLFSLLSGGAGIRILLQVFTVFAFLCVLDVVTFVDHDTMEIPNRFILAMAAVGAVSFFTMPETGIIDRLIGAVCTSVPLFIITLFIPGAFGGGDIKLLAVSGLFLGWKLSLLALFIGIITGGGYGIYLLATKKAGRKDHFAFGPFLCFGLAMAAFFGMPMIRWYLNLLFLQ